MSLYCVQCQNYILITSCGLKGQCEVDWLTLSKCCSTEPFFTLAFKVPTTNQSNCCFNLLNPAGKMSLQEWIDVFITSVRVDWTRHKGQSRWRTSTDVSIFDNCWGNALTGMMSECQGWMAPYKAMKVAPKKYKKKLGHLKRPLGFRWYLISFVHCPL